MLQIVVDFLAKSHGVKLILYCLVETLADLVGLGPTRTGFTVINILDSQVELVFVVLAIPTIFGASIGEDAVPSNGFVELLTRRR